MIKINFFENNIKDYKDSININSLFFGGLNQSEFIKNNLKITSEPKLYNEHKDFIIDVRGRGLMNAIEFENSKITEKISLELLNNGLLTKSTHDTVLRLSPPLIINEEEILESIDIIKKSLSKI